MPSLCILDSITISLHVVPACAGTASKVLKRSASFQFNYQTATFVYARAFVPAPRASFSFSLAPRNNEGHGAPRGANVLFRFLCEKEARRLTALHSQVYAVCASLTAIWRRFFTEEPCFRDRTSAYRASDPAGFRPPSSCPRPAIEGRAT